MRIPKATQRLLVIEPNLRTTSGHYAEFVRALGLGANGQTFDVYANPTADALLSEMPGVKADSVTPRAGQLLAEFRVMVKMIRKDRPFLILTSDGRHTLTASIACCFSRSGLQNAAFYFHRMPSGYRLMLLRLSNTVKKKSLAIAPTDQIANDLKKLGWQKVICHPYPALAPLEQPRPVPFQHLLFAGTARINKGLDLITGMLRLWKQQQRSIPLIMQISKKRANRHGKKEGKVLSELMSIEYPQLQADENPADRNLYCSRFKGALVLAPYYRERFADAVSGVVLDALLHGAPVIATRGTWPGNQVDRFGAGITIENRTPQALSTAVDQILNDWDSYSARACIAAKILKDEHDPQLLFNKLNKLQHH